MAQLKAKLIVSDFDNTLITSDQKVLPEVREAISRYVADGGVFAVCTGRILAAILPRVRELGLKGLVSACQSSVIADIQTGELLRVRGLAPGQAAEVCAEIERAGQSVNVYSGDNFYTSIPKDNEYLKMYERIIGVRSQHIDIPLSEFVRQNSIVCQKVASLCPASEKDNLYRRLLAKFKGRYDITCSADVLVEALTFNKFALNNFLRAYPQLHLSDSLLVRKGEPLPDDKAVVERLGLPCFVKPNAGGSSFGVTKVKTEADLRPAIGKAMAESPEVMIEKMMEGTEITCGCFKRGDEIVALPITEVVTTEEFFDYDAKYNGKVSEITPARIAPATAARVSDMTRDIYRILGCYGIIRVDYILSGPAGNEQINLLEINTTPGMTATSFIPQQVRAAGLSMADVLTDIIEGKF